MYSRTLDFLMAAIIVFFATFTLLGTIGVLPSDLQASLNAKPILSIASVSSLSQTTSANADDQLAPIKYTAQGEKEYPVRIEIDKIGVNAPVNNPKSISIDALDQSLLTGAVRYPTSAALNEGGNVYLFGHSSYLKIVHNQAYRTFNGLKDLKVGDEIKVDGPENEYIYTVSTVSLLKDTDAVVNLGQGGNMLTLSTCDTFGEKEDRIIVTAAFSRSYVLSQSITSQ